MATKSKLIAKAEEYKIHVVSKDALSNNIKTEGIIAQFEKHSLCEWGTNVSNWILNFNAILLMIL